MGTSPTLMMFDESVKGMDIMTCCKWTNELKIKLLCWSIVTHNKNNIQCVRYYIITCNYGHIFINVYLIFAFIVIMKT
jgi:ABC-type molybdenum transport system ATPase subunit/photorepair protein PhrA